MYRLALVVTRLYGATFLALSLGWALAWCATLLLNDSVLDLVSPRLGAYRGLFFAYAIVHLVGGAVLIALSRLIAKLAVKP